MSLTARDKKREYNRTYAKLHPDKVNIKCIHNRAKTKCRECGGGAICVHDKIRINCKICAPYNFCCHNRRTTTCRDCKGTNICEHKKNKYRCKDCNGGSLCQHGIEKRACKVCEPLLRAYRLLYRNKMEAKKGGYKPANISVEEFINLQNTSFICCGCEEPLDWDGQTPCLHHNHETGEVIGFAHRFCNMFEGQTQKLGEKRIVSLIRNFFPDIVPVLRAAE